MLDIDLIQEAPALNTEFRVSLAANLIATMSLVLDAGSIEGLDQWVYTAHAALSEELRESMAPVLTFITKSALYYDWLYTLAPDVPAHRDFAAFVAWLNDFSPDDYEKLLDSFVEQLKACESVTAGAGGLEELLKTCYGEKLDEGEVERIVYLYRNPAEFKAELLFLVTHFWEQFYREEFERCLPVMDRSVGYHRRQSYGVDLRSVFAEVTGRRFPTGYEEHLAAVRVIFVPSCHIGPYVIMNACDCPERTLIIHYNARTTGSPDRPEQEEQVIIQDVFPPLKALADETRLQIMAILDGRELYAQQIVDQLDISQSAVSRQLALMVAGGLLDVRREESMKYYTINEETLAALAERIRRFRGPGKP